MDAFTNKTSQQPAAGAQAGQKDDYVDKGEYFSSFPPWHRAILSPSYSPLLLHPESEGLSS